MTHFVKTEVLGNSSWTSLGTWCETISLEKWNMIMNEFALYLIVFFGVSSALQAGRDESGHVDEAQVVIDAKASVPPL